MTKSTGKPLGRPRTGCVSYSNDQHRKKPWKVRIAGLHYGWYATEEEAKSALRDALKIQRLRGANVGHT